MPELPEVECLKNAIKSVAYKAKFKDFIFYRDSLRQKIPVSAIYKCFKNTNITSIERRSKYILISNQTHTLLLHLGMSGNVIFSESSLPLAKHTHYIITLTQKRKTFYLHYIDPRRFGILSYQKNHSLNQNPLLKHLGPEPLVTKDLHQHLYNLAKKTKTPIKSFIMNASNVVGVGNIYANESLFLSKIHPHRPASSLSQAEFKILNQKINHVLTKAIKAGGTTLKDYKSLSGEPGYFRIKLNVYDRADEACKLCGTSILTTRIVGRSTFFCPNCQKD